MGIDLQGAQYGSPIPVVFGRNKLAGNVIDYMDFKAIAHTQKQQGGKGGGGGGQASTSYTYQCSYLLGLAEGVGNIVTVYDGSSTTTLSAVGGLAFTGAQGQSAWSHLSGDHALGYSGTVLAAFQNKDLGSSASLPNYNFEIDGRNQFSASIKDANPADIATAICTDSQIGVQFNALGDLTAFKNYCTAAGLFFSPVYSTQTPAQQALDDLFKYANSAPFFSEGVLKVVPYGDATITGNGVTYTPSLTAVADLGRDDFITNGPGDPVTVKRIAPADAMNMQRVEFKDRANTYHTGTVVASIDQDVVGTGARADQSDSVDMVTQAAVAKLVAQNLLQRTYYIRNTYEFQLSWRYCYLEPMDIVTLTDANTGLYLTPVRITEVSEDEHGLLSIVAEEFPEGISHASIYATQPNAGTSVDPNADPGPVDGPYLFRGPGFLVSNNQPEIWCALSGTDPLWAGCDVYLSHDGTSYTYLTTHSQRAAYGELTNSLAAGSDPDTTGAPNVVLNGPVELLGGTQADADQFITLAMIDNELVAYQTATLAGGPSYTLGYLRRGGYGSDQVAHSAGAPFVRLDENILRIPVDPSQIGQTVYLKFVSFNVFGKGGRTLADETAYTYIVGTNIELPDVPVTPNSPAVTAVADGVSITWFNPNPAAVGCTSIEYATASGGPWTVLAQVGPTSTSYVHHFTTGATYYYRLRSRGAVVSAGWSAYTAVLTNKGKTVADGADVTAAVNVPHVINGNFLNGTAGWTFDNPTGFYQNGTDGNSPDSACPTHLVRQGQAGGATTYARNTGYVSVVPGQTITVACCLRGLSANAGSSAGCRISWRDASHTEVATTLASITCGPTGQTVSKAVGAAPAGAQFAHFELYYVNHSSGYYNATSCVMTVQPASLDEVPDSSTWGKTRLAALINGSIPLAGAGKSLIGNPTFSRNTMGIAKGLGIAVGAYAVDNWTLAINQNAATWAVIPESTDILFRVATGASVPNGATVVSVLRSEIFPVSAGQVIVAELNASVAFASIPPAGVNTYTTIQVAWLKADGSIISGAEFARVGRASSVVRGSLTAPADTAAAWIEVDGYISNTSGSTYVAGSLPYDCRVISAQGYSVSDLATEVSGTLSTQRNLPLVTWGNYGGGWSGLSVTYTTTTTSASFSASAASFVGGGDSIAYNSGNVTVSGSPGATVTYYFYYDDPGMTGGSKSLQATTSQITSLNANGRVFVGQATITYPTSGTGSGGGQTGCPQVDEPVIRRASDGSHETIRAGDVRVGDDLLLASGRWGRVSYSEAKLQPGVRVVGLDGSSIICSESAPLETADGLCVRAPYTRDLVLKHRTAGVMRVAEVFDVGDILVQHITCENDCFWVGDYSHHNMKPAK
ncbi:Putative phage tail protein [Frateuria terrea]|uniref:Putative phage tail protein n=2 Tax=Frateuria terrea TaxID=529704 RepID=A0A1H6ZRP2_9GAMM|nr:Putative phage tail protein [Frateuria terrea]SFP46677.1 Putative phage tail protein [Frateuria terrea]